MEKNGINKESPKPGIGLLKADNDDDEYLFVEVLPSRNAVFALVGTYIHSVRNSILLEFEILKIFLN